MRKVCLTMLLCAATAAAQYKMEPAGAPPPELDAAIAGALQKEGAKIVAANGSVVCEIWLRATMPSGPKANEDGVTLPTIPHGALLGAIRFPVPGSERRGQSLKPGVYTLRFSYYPVDGNHQCCTSPAANCRAAARSRCSRVNFGCDSARAATSCSWSRKP